jgi:hypothetical protein
MKKALIPVFALIVGFSSCQKDEFTELVKSNSETETLQITSDGEIIETEVSNTPQRDFVEESRGANEIDLWEKEDAQISIKEVSDGDDEADDGDDSKTD